MVQIFYATDRKPTGSSDPKKFFGAERAPGGALSLGTCDVSIPRDHRLAALEEPSIWRLEFSEDPERHVVLLGVEPVGPQAFSRQLRGRVGRSAGRQAFVFVHGFLVSFEDAARRTAQLAYDLQFDGAPILWSWPAADRLAGYAAAESNADWSVAHLLAFLRQLKERSGADDIHLISHSMGSRVVTQALNLLALTEGERLPLFKQVVLTAPDIDAEVFLSLAEQIRRTAGRVTLYASQNDQALDLSRRLHAYPRAGQAGKGLVTVPGIDTIDVSQVDSSFEGHFYYADNRSVISDLVALIREGKPPHERSLLQQIQEGARSYWRLLPQGR